MINYDGGSSIDSVATKSGLKKQEACNVSSTSLWITSLKIEMKAHKNSLKQWK